MSRQLRMLLSIGLLVSSPLFALGRANDQQGPHHHLRSSTPPPSPNKAAAPAPSALSTAGIPSLSVEVGPSGNVISTREEASAPDERIVAGREKQDRTEDGSEEEGTPWLLPTPSRPARQLQSLVPDILTKGAFPLDIHNSTSNTTSTSNSSTAQAPGAAPRQLQSLVPDIVTKGAFPLDIHNSTSNTTSTSNNSAAQGPLESPGAAPRQLQSLVPDIITKGTFSFTIHNGSANATAAVGDVVKEVRAVDEARDKVLHEDRLRMDLYRQFRRPPQLRRATGINEATASKDATRTLQREEERTERPGPEGLE